MKQFDLTVFERIPVIGILRHSNSEEIRKAARAFHAVGFRTLEVTMNSADAAENISYLSKLYPDMNIGAGTVCTTENLSTAREAGASFIVSPVTDITLIGAAREAGLAVFPGAFTPTEIYRAWQAGATAIKVFPMSALGPSYLKEVHAPLPEIKLVAVGGVTLDNINDYFAAGAYGVALGSGLFRKDLMEGDYETLKQYQEKMYERVMGMHKTTND
ncbi:MAG: bifunctional 4-hydroxy-2-oxoglutarate aldolase/2-dehydro-3-deoxy-phosphogluconate aldolase [Saprospiraceae bacterium]|nr:bifunctional 4-hydroxy-2-oxoglutarate aldolase/2-dehydro-3-deoxy-phosphogluconate aldolase [Saprospiraceae bacterium]